MYIHIYIYIYTHNAQRGNGIWGKGPWNKARALRTTPSGEKQGL